MKVASFNGCKVYNLSSGKTFATWLPETKRRQLAKDEDYRRRLELIQDFEMNTAVQCIKLSPDRENIIATGTYPPCVRCYTVNDLALKFHRGLNCEVVDFEILSDNFGKLVFLQADRTINVHAPYGTHYSTRVPKFGRCIQYNWNNCDLLVASSGNEIYRLNLEVGQFKEPFQLNFTGCNKIHINPSHQLLGCGGEQGICEFWDLRSRKCVSSLMVTNEGEITALKFDTDGLTLGVGTSNGKCLLYDIRSTRPLMNKEHQYGEPMVDILFHHTSRTIISADKKIIKIWERDEPNQGKMVTNIETPCDINNLMMVEDRRGETGMLMVAGEQNKVLSYFIPQLGPAPRWCSFLESLTEELEESANQTVYEDFKFLTRVEVDELGASNLIGTPSLRSYMHGFFMEMKLYTQLRAVSKPFEYEEYRKKMIQEKLEQKRASRIAPRKRVKKNDGTSVDPRFAGMQRDEFKVDKESEEYRLRHPVQGKYDNGNDSDDLRSDDESVNEEQVTFDNDDDGSDDYDDDEGDVSDEDFEQVSENGDYDEIVQTSMKKLSKTKANSAAANSAAAKKSKGPKFYELSDTVISGNKKGFTSAATAAFAQSADDELNRRNEKKKSSKLTLSQRLAIQPTEATSNSFIQQKDKIRTIRPDDPNSKDGIIREISFMPKNEVKGRGGGIVSKGMRREEKESFASMQEDNFISNNKPSKKSTPKKSAPKRGRK